VVTGCSVVRPSAWAPPIGAVQDNHCPMLMVGAEDAGVLKGAVGGWWAARLPASVGGGIG